MAFTSRKVEVLAKTRQAIDQAMEAVGQAGEANAVREVTKLVYDTPPSPTYIRTGRLRSSITHKYVSSEKAAYIGTNVEYAPYVEFGTRKMQERPFLRRAAQGHVDEYMAILQSILKQLS